MTIKLLIKGTAAEAALALAKRDIPVLDLKDAAWHYPKASIVFPEALAKVHDCYAGRVRAWFNSEPSLPPPGGFPPGTLLYFHETELSELLTG